MLNETFRDSGKEFLNRPLRWMILVFFMFLFGVLLYGGFEAKKTCNNRVVDWFPEEFPETQKMYSFSRYFGSSEMVMVSWDDLLPLDPIQNKLAAAFESSPGLDASGKPLPPLVRRTLTTEQMLRRLDEINEKRYSREPAPKTIREISNEQLQGWLLSRDFGQGCIIVMASPAGAADRPALLKKLYADTMRLTGLTHEEIHLAGATCDSVAIDEATYRSNQTLLPIFGLLCSVLLFWCLKNPILSITVFMMALVNQEIGPAAIYFTGSHMDSISLLISALTFVLTMESGIHLSNYYKDSVLEYGTHGAVLRTMKKGALPCTLATVTTVLGMGSLAISQVAPIRNFGIYTSIALTCGTLFLFLFFLAYWENWGPFEYYCPGWRREKFPPVLNSIQRNESNSQEEFVPRKTLWGRLAAFIVRAYWGIILLSLGLIVAFIPLVGRLETNITLHGMLKPNNEVIIDYNYLEDHFGGLVPIEVGLQIPENETNLQRSRLEHLELIRLVQNALKEVPGLDCTVSVLNVLPALPSLTARSNTASSMRRVYNRQLDENIQELEESQFYCRAENEEMWRISTRVKAGADLEYESLLQAMELKVYETLLKNGITYAISEKQVKDAPFLAEARKKAGEKGIENSSLAQEQMKGDLMKFRDVSIVVTGAIPLVFKAQQQLLKDLIDSFVMAFALISGTLILLQRSIFAGLVAMIPNILPSIVVFGILAAIQIRIDIGSMMTASVALGITVDGTLHLLTWFRRGTQLGYDRKNAVIYAYTHCADAMLQTAFICSFTFLVFAFSGFVPVARFAWMLCVLLTVAVCTDLFLTPALLISPLGRFFVPVHRRKNESINN